MTVKDQQLNESLHKVQTYVDFLSDEVIDNSRYISLEYNINHTSVLHGFAGYFDSKLYGNVYLSK